MVTLVEKTTVVDFNKNPFRERDLSKHPKAFCKLAI